MGCSSSILNEIESNRPQKISQNENHDQSQENIDAQLMNISFNPHSKFPTKFNEQKTSKQENVDEKANEIDKNTNEPQINIALKKKSQSTPIPFGIEKNNQDQQKMYETGLPMKLPLQLPLQKKEEIFEEEDQRKSSFEAFIKKDSNLEKSINQSLLDPIGMIKRYKQESHATAFLFNKQFILTNAHAILHFDLPKQMRSKQKKMYFHALRSDSNKQENQKYSQKSINFYEKNLIIDYRLYDHMNDSRINPEDKRYCDFAVLMLEKPLSSRSTIKLGTVKDFKDKSIEIYGFPKYITSQKMQETENMEQYGKNGIGSFKDGLIWYDITTSLGSSGSPILQKLQSQEYIAIGIHCGTNKEEKLNFGVYFDEDILEKINSWALEMMASQYNKLLKKRTSTLSEDLMPMPSKTITTNSTPNLPNQKITINNSDVFSDKVEILPLVNSQKLQRIVEENVKENERSSLILSDNEKKKKQSLEMATNSFIDAPTCTSCEKLNQFWGELQYYL